MDTEEMHTITFEVLDVDAATRQVLSFIQLQHQLPFIKLSYLPVLKKSKQIIVLYGGREGLSATVVLTITN